MSTLVTFDKVSAAAQRLHATGQRPTVRLLIATLGGGSPNAILPLLNQWKAAQSPSSKAELTLEPAIAKVIAQQLAVMTAQATSLAEARITELTADIELVANAGRAAEETIQQLTQQLTQAQSQIQQLTGQLTQRATEIEALQADSSKQVQSLQTSVEHERQLAQGFRDDLMRAQFKLENFADLQANVSALTTQLQEAQRASALSSQEAAVAQAKLAAQIERSEEARVRELALINRTS